MKKISRSCCLFIFWIFSCAIFCSAEHRYLEKKDINEIMQQILSEHLDAKGMTTAILKHSFKIYIDQFDPERIYLLQSEVEPYLNMGEEKLRTLLAQYKQSNFQVYEELNQLIQRAIIRARKIRSELQERNAAEIFSQSSGSLASGFEEWSDPDLRKFFAKNEKELSDRIKGILIRFVDSQKRRFGDAYVQKRQDQILALFNRQAEQHENSYLFVNEQNQPMTANEKQNDFVMHILKSLASSLDAHTSVLNPMEAQEMRLRLEKEVQGIGIGLQQKPDGNFFVTLLVEGGPAAKSGQIKLNDILISVDQQPVKDLPLSRVREMIQGKQGTSVTLLFKRTEEGAYPYERTFSVQLTRAEITVNEERAESWSETFGDGIIGVIKLDSFYQGDNGVSSEADVRNAIQKLDKQGKLRGLILDLRENSGGFLSQAIKVVSLFISNGIVVISKYFNGEEHIYRDVEGKRAFDGPLIVLTSKATASAAEIVAQALQDYGVALIVGDKHTYGKGTIQSQTITQEGNAAFFKVTVGTYYTVSGKTPQMRGVQADIEVPSPFFHENIGEEYLDYPVKQDTIPPAYKDALSDISPNLKPWYMHYYLPTLQKRGSFWQNNLATLRKNSSYRISNNKDFQAFLKGTYQENFGKEDLQMAEAINIMKDMIMLHPQAN